MGKEKGRVINDGGKDKLGVTEFESPENERQGDDKEEGAARIALCNAFP